MCTNLRLQIILSIWMNLKQKLTLAVIVDCPLRENAVGE